MNPAVITELLHAEPFRPFKVNHGAQSVSVFHPEFAYQLPTDRTVLIVAKQQGGFFMFSTDLINVEVFTPTEANKLASSERGE